MLIDKLKKEGLYTPEAILFILGVQHQDLHPELLDYVSEFKDANVLGALFTEYKGNKVSLTETFKPKRDFIEFIKLLESYGVSSNGYVDKQAKYSIKPFSQEARQNFDILTSSYEVDLVHLAEKTAEFYAATEMPPSLANYLEHTAPLYCS